MPNILKYSRVLGKGVAATFGPSIMKGALVELFKRRGVDVKKATLWIETNKSLWDSFDPERKRQFRHLAAKVGDMSWFTTDWAIDSLREEYPAVASLFLGWKKGANWLARQIEIIKQELQGGG